VPQFSTRCRARSQIQIERVEVLSNLIEMDGIDESECAES
jgi:hypothetical protein